MHHHTLAKFVLTIPFLVIGSSVLVARNTDDNSAARSDIPVPTNGSMPDDSARHSTWGIGLHYGQPLDGFADALDKTFFGLGAQVAFHVKELPLDVGFGLGWDWLERTTKDVSVIRSSLPDTTGELIAQSQSYGILPMVRYRPFQGPVMIYGEVYGGARLFMSNSKVDVDSRDKPINRRYQEADVALEWGLAGGLMVRTGKNFLIEARWSRSWGGQARYIDLDNITTDAEGRIAFNTLSSTTGAWRLQIGLAQYF